MQKNIDCLLIGHNDINFELYEQLAGNMGPSAGAYRDLNLNFVRRNGKPLTSLEMFNAMDNEEKYNNNSTPLRFGTTFSATIGYLGSYLDRNGFTFDYIQSFQEEKALLKEKLEQDNILTVAIITTLYVLALPIIEIIDFVRSYNHNVKIIVGGPFVSTQIRSQDPLSLEFLFNETIQADYFVNSSQGETTLVEILNSLKKNIPKNQINNIHYKQDGKLYSTQILKENNKLDENSVNWKLFSERIGKHVNVRTSISCPYSCSFCGFPEHAGKYQTLDVQGIEKELNQLEDIGTIQSVNFIDDTFNVPPKRFKEILRMMIKNKYSFKWHSYYRCQFADPETVEMMKESGCEGVFLGLETGNETILKNMNKSSQVEKYLEGISVLKKYGITTFGCFIIGFPGETNSTVQDTIRFIKESGLDFYRVQLWYCELITPIWKEREKYNITGQNFEWSHNTMNSQTASDIIEEIFSTIQDPIWLPQYNFDFDTMWHLVHNGMTLEKVKEFLRIFYQEVKVKLESSNPTTTF
jgi:anaerobic magnesium-protoporphyrin IX monomethyl ester cyclase